jgi:selenide,water dikinase
MCVASGVGAELEITAVPVINGVRDLLDMGMVAGGTQRNHAFVAPDVDFADLPEAEQLLLADAQTSGGLLLAVAPEHTTALVEACEARGTLAAAVIGTLTGEHLGRIIVRRD